MAPITTNNHRAHLGFMTNVVNYSIHKAQIPRRCCFHLITTMTAPHASHRHSAPSIRRIPAAKPRCRHHCH
jgi:hypothetical protein